jgi:cytochrome c-type biogenesis protein CcmH
MRSLAAYLFVLLLALPALAVEPDEILEDPVLEARARDLSTQLRCVVCQNQDIDSSNAGVARDLRILVRERLVSGDTDEQVLDFVVARYGDYVLFRPPWKPTTYALWIAPFLVLAIGGVAVGAVLMRARSRSTPLGLSTQEEAEFADLKKQLEQER